MADIISEIKGAIVSIKVVGVGGGGNNVLLRLLEDKAADVELIGINTDSKQLACLENAGVEVLQIGERYTRGRGTGGNISQGEAAAVEDEERIAGLLRGADLIFVTASMGGGTGTGAAPVVAKVAREMGILSVGVVTLPFGFEGSRKMRIAKEGVGKMQAYMDALIVINNDNLMKLPENRRMSMVQAFKAADEILRQAISCISEMVLTTGVVNVDFADLTSIFRQSDSSDAILGIGFSEGGHAVEAVQRAIESPLIEKTLAGARGIIINIGGGEELSLAEVNDATQYIYENTHDDVNIIFGVVIDKTLGESVRATIVATDFADSISVKAPKLGNVKEQLSSCEIVLPDFMTSKMQDVSSFDIPVFNKDNPQK